MKWSAASILPLAVLKTFGFEEYKVELSTWDPNDKKSYVGADENWNLAIHSLENALKRKKFPTKPFPAKPHFTGPRSTSSWWMPSAACGSFRPCSSTSTCPRASTWNTSAKMATRHQPVMVHRALFGSVERFFGVLIEHYAGAFPVWLSPVQVALMPISEKHVDYANKVAEQLKAAGVRVHVDDRNEKMNAKVREQTMQKVPFLLVVGEKEAEAGTVNVRVRGQQQPEGTYPATEFVERVKKLIASKAVSLT